MSNAKTRIISAMVLILGLIGIIALEYFKIPAVRLASVLIAAGMVVEFAICVYNARAKIFANKSLIAISGIFLLWLLVIVGAAWAVGAKPWIMFLMLLIISASDIGAWGFGHLIGGDKMWPALSPNKTWSGQIAGIICGTVASLSYGFIGTAIVAGHFDYGQFVPQLLWIGITVALLSQYGDLTESWIKRKFGIKDSSKLIPGHGGLLDRFDGWIYVLPIVWLVMG